MSRRLEEAIRRLEKKVRKVESITRNTSTTFVAGDITVLHSHTGDTLVAGNSTSETVGPAKGQLAFMNSSKQWIKASAGNGAAGGNIHPIGIALSAVPHTDGVLALGLYKLDTSHVSGSSGTFDIGKQVFMSPETSGSFTTMIPSGSGQFVRVLGHAVDTDVIYFNPSGDFIEV